MAEEATQVEQNAQAAVEQQVERPQAEAPQEPVAEEKPSNVSIDDDGTIKVDLRQQPQTEEKDAVQEQETTSVDVGKRTTDSEEMDQEVRSDNNESEDEQPAIELVHDE